MSSRLAPALERAIAERNRGPMRQVRLMPSRPDIDPWVEMPCGCEVFLSGHANVCDGCETAMRAATGDPVARLVMGENIEEVVA